MATSLHPYGLLPNMCLPEDYILLENMLDEDNNPKPRPTYPKPDDIVAGATGSAVAIQKLQQEKYIMYVEAIALLKGCLLTSIGDDNTAFIMDAATGLRTLPYL
jgi:hypothetical protein